MNSIRLSICIPIYNFGEFIGDTLESIIQQATDEVEIVVVDGGSTDNTEEIIHNYQLYFPRLNYIRFEKRGGIDVDMAKTVESARGDYCWLFGGDDIMAKSALKKVLTEITFGCDLYLCENTLCTFDLKPIRKHQIFNLDKEMVFDLSKRQDRAIYFEKANTTAAFFSFCGALIFKRNRWGECEIYTSFNGSLWAHATRFFEMMKSGLTVKYIPQSLLEKRSDNDSFLSSGIVNRFSISVDGYHKIADYFFGADSIEAFHIRRSLRSELPFRHIMNLKLEVAAANIPAEMKLLNRLVCKHYSDFSIANFIYLNLYRLIPAELYRASKSIRKNIIIKKGS